MTDVLWNLAFFLLALGILITIHEFGHFWVARRCGVKVERFSIGFGKAIWQRVANDGTEYTLAMIPLGGYVKMLDSRVDDVPEHLQSQAFNHKPLWQRAAIVAAGPIANFLFAIVAYWCVLVLGTPALKPVIGEVAPQSIAAQAGIVQGMELTAVSGIKTPDWESANMQLIGHIGDEQMVMTVKPNVSANYQVEKRLNLTDWSFDPEQQSPLQTLGITPYMPPITRTVAQVINGGAAASADIKVGDEIIAINGQLVESWQQIVTQVQTHPDMGLEITLLRNGKQLTLPLVPNARKDGEKTIGYAGFSPKVEAWPESYHFTLQYGPLDAIPAAFEKTWQVVVITAQMIKKLIVGDVAVKNLSGPISIAKGAGMTADYGLVFFLSFLALISVNLGIMNLLPLPVLDGGHLLFFGVEAVTGRPVSERIQEIGYRLGSAVIFLLMVVAIFNDVARL